MRIKQADLESSLYLAALVFVLLLKELLSDLLHFLNLGIILLRLPLSELALYDHCSSLLGLLVSLLLLLVILLLAHHLLGFSDLHCLSLFLVALVIFLVYIRPVLPRLLLRELDVTNGTIAVIQTGALKVLGLLGSNVVGSLVLMVLLL